MATHNADAHWVVVEHSLTSKTLTLSKSMLLDMIQDRGIALPVGECDLSCGCGDYIALNWQKSNRRQLLGERREGEGE